MASVDISIFNDFSLNTTEKKILSHVAQENGIRNVNFYCPPFKKKIIPYFLNKELKKFEAFLLTQDTSNRINLKKRRHIENHSNLHDNITIAIHLSNSSNNSIKVSKFNKSYLIRFNENFSNLNSYILDSIIRRKDFIELNCIEISDHEIKKDFKISCQTVELYVISLFKVYSVIINEIVSTAYRNEI